MTIPAPWSLPAALRHRIRQELRVDAAYHAFVASNALLDGVIASARHNRVRSIRIAY